MSRAAVAAPRRSEPRFDVVGVGEISLDHRIAVDLLPTSGSKQAALASAQLPGGQVATALLGCARLGLTASFVGAVGSDDVAPRALAPLRDAGVALDGVQTIAGGRTRCALVLVETARGERSVIELRDAATCLEPEQLDLAAIRAARALLVDTTSPAASLAAARAASEAGVPVFLDADAPSRELDELTRWVAFPVVPGQLASEIASGGSVLDGLRKLTGLGARVAVATLGERGAIALDSAGRVFASGAFAVDAVDTTGAGDAFRAAWIDAVLRGIGVRDALRWANAGGAFACTAEGAQAALATREILEDFSRAAEVRPPPDGGVA